MKELIFVVISLLSIYHDTYAGLEDFKQAIKRDTIDYAEVKNALKYTNSHSLNSPSSYTNYLACVNVAYRQKKSTTEKNKLINIAIYLRYKGAKFSQNLTDITDYNVLRAWGRGGGAGFFVEGPLMGCSGSFKNKNIPETIADINDLINRINEHNRQIKSTNKHAQAQIAALPEDLPELYDEEFQPQHQPKPTHIISTPKPQSNPGLTTQIAPKPPQPEPKIEQLHEIKKYPIDFCDDPEGLLKYYQQTKDPSFLTFSFRKRVDHFSNQNTLNCASPKMVNKLADWGFLQQFPGIDRNDQKKVTTDVRLALNESYNNLDDILNPLYGKPTFNRALDDKELFKALTHLMHEYSVAPNEVIAWCAKCNGIKQLVHTVIHRKPEFVPHLFKKGSDHKKRRIQIDEDTQILAEQNGIKVIQDKNKLFIAPTEAKSHEDELQVKISNLKESLVSLKKKLKKLKKHLTSLRGFLATQ
ncbi:hypothetical protein JST56_00435 [Candidatus Dependentiae bacterium]|nr:hypothetical protein [Candidatus Dependentiae bacterium]